jgi:hypothetical protein
VATTLCVAAAPAGAKPGGNGGRKSGSTNAATGGNNVVTWSYWCEADGTCYYFIPLT